MKCPGTASRPVNFRSSAWDIKEVNVQNQNLFGPNRHTFESSGTPMTENGRKHHSVESLQSHTVKAGLDAPRSPNADEPTPMQLHCTAPICRSSPGARAPCPLQLQDSLTEEAEAACKPLLLLPIPLSPRPDFPPLLFCIFVRRRYESAGLT